MDASSQREITSVTGDDGPYARDGVDENVTGKIVTVRIINVAGEVVLEEQFNATSTVGELREIVALTLENPPSCVHLNLGTSRLRDNSAALDTCGAVAGEDIVIMAILMRLEECEEGTLLTYEPADRADVGRPCSYRYFRGTAQEERSQYPTWVTPGMRLWKIGHATTSAEGNPQIWVECQNEEKSTWHFPIEDLAPMEMD